MIALLLGCVPSLVGEPSPEPGSAWAALWDDVPDDSAADSDAGVRPPDRTRELLHLAGSTNPRPNIIVIMSDDQRADTMWAMPITSARIGGEGVTFLNARSSSPLCCPARAGFLSGGYRSTHTGVLGNEQPNGGAHLFDATGNIGVRMQAAGYQTGLIGKYLNQYADDGVYTVPPGWGTWWAAGGFPSYWNYDFVRGRSGEVETTGSLDHLDNRYLTDQIFDEASAFVRSVPEPFFLVVTAFAPHSPYQPDPADSGAFKGYTYRGAGWMEEDISDKPAITDQVGEWDEAGVEAIDLSIRSQMEMLPSMDRGVGRLLDAMEQRGIAGDTVVAFLSDNGYLWGEHRLVGKMKPYLPAVSVPFMIRAPGMAPMSVKAPVAANLSLAATIQDIAGLPPVGDGESLLSILQTGEEGPLPPVIAELADPTVPTFVVAEVEDWRLILWSTGEIELYDLKRDPGEEENLASAPPKYAPYDRLLELATANQPLVQLAVELPAFVFGTPVSFSISAVGGLPPYAWSISAGNLPAGVRLNPLTGEIAGTPDALGTFEFEVAVQDRNVSRYTREAQRSILRYSVEVGVGAAKLRRPPKSFRQGDNIHLDLSLSSPEDIRWRWAQDDSMEGAIFRTESNFARGAIVVPIPRGEMRFVEVYAGSKVLWKGRLGP